VHRLEVAHERLPRLDRDDVAAVLPDAVEDGGGQLASLVPPAEYQKVESRR